MFIGGGIVLALFFGIYFYIQYNDPEKVKVRESASLVAEVGELMFLPEGETPTIATVTEPGKLANQPFFKNAMLNDKVLIYSQERKIILYRPAENKIVEVASLSPDEK